MPIYGYHDKKSGKTIHVIRSFSDYETPPSKEEATVQSYAGKVTLTEEEFEVAEFERRIESGITVTYAQGKMKGGGGW